MNLADFERNFVVRFNSLIPAEGSAAADGHSQPTHKSLPLIPKSLREDSGAERASPVKIDLAYEQCDPGAGFSSQAHPAWEIFLPVKGSWHIEMHGCTDVDLGPQDVVIFPGGIHHTTSNKDDDKSIILRIKPYD